MQNTQATTDALFSASYVDNYLEFAERIPDDIQRQITRIHDIDVQFRGFLRDVDHYQDLLRAASTNEKNPELRKTKRQRSISRMHQALIRAQELSDEKMHLVSQMQELIDGNTRKLETVKDNVDIREEMEQLHAQQMQQQDYAEQTNKRARTSSPSDNMLGAGTERIPSSKDSGYNSFPGSSSSAISNMENCTQIAVSSLNMLAVESTRGSSKRSRRRNDTSDYDSHLAYDCNNVIGNVALGERSSSGSRPLNASSQKKGVVHVSNVAGSSGGSAGKKKRKSGSGRQTNTTNQVQANARDDTPPIEAIDPDEPTYCVCNQISFGEMILCDNDLCPIEWFHFSCVSLVLKPKGKWYCPNCRGDRPNIMKPKAQFLRELERYNKEKEERT